MKKALTFSALAVSLILLITLGFYSKKFIVDEINKQLQAHTTKDAKVNEVDFDLWNFEVKFSEIKLSEKAKIGSLFLKLNPKGLLNREIRITTFKIGQISLPLELDGKEVRLPFLNLPKKKPSQSEIREKEKELKIFLPQLNLADTKIFLEDHSFEISSLELKDIFYSTRTGLLKEKIKSKLRAKIQDCLLNLEGGMDRLAFDVQDCSISRLKPLMTTFKDFIPAQKQNILAPIEADFSLKSVINGPTTPKKMDIDFELAIKDFSLQNKNKPEVYDYFVKEFNLKSGTVSFKPDVTIVNFGELKIENLITPIKKETIKGMKFSKFSGITLTSFQLTHSESEINLKTNYNNGGLIKIKKITKDQQNGSLEVTLQGLDMVPFGETFGQNLGYQITKGKIDGDIKTVTKNNKVKGHTKINLNQFELDSESEEGRKLKGKSGIPLATAVSLAKSDEGIIEIDLNVSGTADDPNFGFFPMLRKGIGKVVMDQLVETLTIKLSQNMIPMLFSSIPLNPASALFAVKKGIAFINKPRFKDLSFEPNQTVFSGKSEQALQNFAEFLIKKKSFKFNLCPQAISNEGPENLDNDQALELAKARIETIKEKMKEKGVPSGRYSFCRPTFKEKSTILGLVEISL